MFPFPSARMYCRNVFAKSRRSKTSPLNGFPVSWWHKCACDVKLSETLRSTLLALTTCSFTLVINYNA